jgi:RES domain.
MPATQLLALVAYLTREFVGIKYNSVRTALGTNVVVFPDRLAEEDRLEVVDSTGRLVQRLGATPPTVATTPVE